MNLVPSKRMKKYLAGMLLVALCMAMLLTLFPATALAALEDYNADDVAVINTIIQNNGLRYGMNDPDSWDFVTWADDALGKRRVVGLSLSGEGLDGAMDLSGLTELITLDCSNSQLFELDASGCSNLTTLDCSNNELNTDLDMSSCIKLTTLDCSSNQLTRLDVSGLTALTTLDCSRNQLVDLDLDTCTALVTLDCSNNELARLDVSGLTALTTLDCSSNQLVDLDLGGLIALTSFYGGNNPLASFTDPNEYSLTISAGSDGNVVFGTMQGSPDAGYNLSTKEITLLPVKYYKNLSSILCA